MPPRRRGLRAKDFVRLAVLAAASLVLAGVVRLLSHHLWAAVAGAVVFAVWMLLAARPFRYLRMLVLPRSLHAWDWQSRVFVGDYYDN